MHSMRDLRVQVHAPDGKNKAAVAPPNFKTGQFLMDLLEAFSLPATADWSVYDADIDRNLDKDKTLEENGVHEGHHLHLRERSGRVPEPGPGPRRPSGQRRAKIGVNDPVVGWLVCIHGPETGKDYKIHSGNNTIGRSPDMDICISGDETISRERHAVVTFDPLSNSFHFGPGEGRSLAYVNDKTVFGTAQLQPYDEIVLGKTKVLFVPFCGDTFIWVKDAV